MFFTRKNKNERFWYFKKNEIFELKGDCSQVSGFIDFSLSNNLNIIPIVNYTATPSGIVEDEVLEYFWQEFERESNEIKSTKIDAIFLSLHGAMITESIFDVEGEILKRIKKNEYLKNVPIFGVFDLHANFTKSMAKNSNGLICYQKNPHTDAYDTWFKAAKLMLESLNQIAKL